ncbi:alpha/beta fold hydrolase [Parafilimonas terrae]|uniref:Pimeloyl-ACP methyl ester carboxylesterase n=1 Tax=Parafilimonas terrae TaxID=1465490 RepID=A0A1I5TIW2_9BACT|nr:alpha/beta hydrolase [Parafilimonas terrae]SFP82306.1 Pimeloyl-ACP methyl ester carboxylesterase [Parafilimonas terrae]
MSKISFQSGYSEVNGLKMYYEIYGEGKPIVLIHGGGSTIQTTYSNIIPLLSKHRQVIAMDLQAHGRTGDRAGSLSFEQDADDVAMLLNNLNIAKADFLGYSNGGQTLIEIALRHTAIVDKMIIASAFYNRSATTPQFWEGFDHATIDVMPTSLKDGFLKVNNDEKALLNMFNKDVQRMKNFKGWGKEQIQSITAPALIINGNNDVGTVEHAVEMYRIMPNAQLVILPGKHGVYIGAMEYLDNGKWTQQYIVDILNEFLDD